MRLLLDTNAFLFSILEPAKLSTRARKALIDPVHAILLSPVSIWEIATKVQIGKLAAPPDGGYFERHRMLLGAEILAVNASHGYRLFCLPMHHKDPFDRLLIAQAIDENLTVITSDRSFQAYPVSTLW